METVKSRNRKNKDIELTVVTEEVFDKSAKSFVSSVRRYPEHPNDIEKEWMMPQVRFISEYNWEPALIGSGWIKDVPNDIIYAVKNELIVSLDDKIVARLNPAFIDLYNEIEKSKYILELEDDWDDEGAQGYKPETWIKSVQFLVRYYGWIRNKTGENLAPPKIYHGPEGSIDLLWKTDELRLLVKISSERDTATFYGDDYNKTRIEGSFDIKGKKNEGFALAVLHCSNFQ